MQPYICKLTPALKDYVWGGRQMAERYRFRTDLDRIAEAWVFSCHKDGASRVSSGPLAGKTLPEALDCWGPAALGSRAAAFPFFPILIKLIDAQGSLSVQVHPDDKYALRVEQEYGKTEMWLVLDAEPGAFLYYGFNRETNRAEVEQHIQNNTLTDLLAKVPVKAGDVFFIEAGTIHAIGAGLLIAEIQQNSNSTYRVYDFGRLGADGQPRPLHVDKALDVLQYGPARPPAQPDGLLADCPYFKAARHTVQGETILPGRPDSFSALLCVEGTALLIAAGEEPLSLAPGDCLFIPADTPACSLTGSAQLIEAFV